MSVLHAVSASVLTIATHVHGRRMASGTGVSYAHEVGTRV
ncbi:hypothetical protein SAM23877_4953 [Streptomyces ambofaciens ATCC 23877]|uniref:Uncharacterized protein n=1 Tax=Streptomyces ambofaciens (strain ATCC 23877 / 3486 / DSM 40053 / JCM 4204 / NBRC 12836 / NRRL B-2516) TaxID=278992 RepID=A0A0K2AYG0_STRA7|nr:hypothetical protein SAM23877_4953 [Streptomyces ambofaciens ATCC 23877]